MTELIKIFKRWRIKNKPKKPFNHLPTKLSDKKGSTIPHTAQNQEPVQRLDTKGVN
jgi:hypothetical protein